MVKFNDIISEFMKATAAHSLILFNFFKRRGKKKQEGKCFSFSSADVSLLLLKSAFLVAVR